MNTVDTVHRAARALLRRPLLRAAEQEEFRLVRSQLAELRSWFDANTGWRLHADADVIRLHKEPAVTDDATRPARDPRNRNAFGRRRYVLFCLCLAALERADAQIPLGRLAEQVLLLARGPAMADTGVEFTLSGRDEKADLVAVVHLLLHWGVLARVAGDEEEYLRGTGDVLYDVSRRVLSQLLVARRGPSTVAAEALEERIAALGAVEPPESDEATNRRLRHRLTRRLLDDPVVYFAELDDAEAEYLRRQRPEPRIEPDQQTGEVDITFEVREKQTGSVGFGTSLGGSLGLTGFLTYEQPNLFGQAKSGNLRWEFGRFSNNFEAGYSDPAILGSWLSGSLSLFSSRDRFFTFQEGQRRRTGMATRVGIPTPWDRYARFTTGYSLSRTTYENFEDDESAQSLFSLPPGVQSTISFGLSRMALEQYFEAIDDLNRALDLEPRRMDALLVRASAYRYLGQIDLARDDVERALGIDPGHPDALLERGVIARTAGDKDAARKDFLAVLHLTAEGPASDAARLNLEAMDVRVE